MGPQKLREQNVRIYRTLILGFFLLLHGCSTIPEVEHDTYEFPKGEAFVKRPKSPIEILGTVKARVEFPTLDSKLNFEKLCFNYYNKGVERLLKYARAEDADIVVDVRSVVFLIDGRHELYESPECSDDGQEGQILLQATAARWVKKTDDN